MAFEENGTGTTMLVQPSGYGGYNNGGFGGDWGWIILLLLCGWGGGFGGGFGGGYGMANWDTMWLLNGQNNTNNNVSSGFRDALLNDGISSIGDKVTSGFGDIQTALCGGFAGVNATVNSVGNSITNRMYDDTIASMQRSFDLQSQIANCCCENRAATADLKYTLASEACASRATSTANTQAILDKLCQLELDGVKAQVEAKNDTISQLRQELIFARGKDSQDVQTAAIIDGTYTRLANCPVSTTPVYGRTPIFTCNNNGCGCGNGFAN